MAPTKQSTTVTGRTSITTRSRTTIVPPTRSKRKAEASPVKQATVKRSAFCDVTNALTKNNVNNDKKKSLIKATAEKKPTANTVQSKSLLRTVSLRTVSKPKQKENAAPPPAPVVKNIVTRGAIKYIPSGQTVVKVKEVPKENANVNRIKTRLSNEFEKTEESLYSTALEDLASKPKTRRSSPGDKSSKEPIASVSMVAEQLATELNLGSCEVPDGVDDFDKENWDDVFQVSHYAMDIFNYAKSRESHFELTDYMERQICLTTHMRALLVDWMVEVQESFELNHESLYLGVKLVDLYLSKVTVGKETLQLVGAAAMFVASKYDERMPPMIDDFLYVCDGAYTRRELIRMEINILKVCDFNLGIPVSYRFLRRYARCGKISMPILTLARFILEYSLMDYATVTVRDSVLAAASLYLALKMKRNPVVWTPALEFYSGYKPAEIMDAVYLLNAGLHRRPRSQLMTVRNKYSHKIFFEVAKLPLLTNDELMS